MAFDDALEAERRNREFQEAYRDREAARWTTASDYMREVIGEFLEAMREAGNPGMRTFKLAKRGGLLTALRPAGRVVGWQVGRGNVISSDGRLFAKIMGKDEVVGPSDPERSFIHSTSIDGKTYGPWSADELRRVLAGVLIDAGAARG